MDLSDDRQTASASLRLGSIFRMEARADFSPAGLVAAGLMVSGILVGSALIVAAAGRARRRLERV